MAISDYIYEKPVNKTERLLLRPMSSSDSPALTQWLSDRELYTHWGKGPSRAEKDPKLLFEKQERPARSFYLGIAMKENDHVVGLQFRQSRNRVIDVCELQDEYDRAERKGFKRHVDPRILNPERDVAAAFGSENARQNEEKRNER